MKNLSQCVCMIFTCVSYVYKWRRIDYTLTQKPNWNQSVLKLTIN